MGWNDFMLKWIMGIYSNQNQCQNVSVRIQVHVCICCGPTLPLEQSGMFLWFVFSIINNNNYNYKNNNNKTVFGKSQCVYNLKIIKYFHTPDCEQRKIPNCTKGNIKPQHVQVL